MVSVSLVDVCGPNVNNIPGMDHLGVLDINIDLNLFAALLPLVELDAGGEVLLAAAAEGPVDNGCIGREFTILHGDGAPRVHRSSVADSHLNEKKT